MPNQRKKARFQLELPISLVGRGLKGITRTGVTKNISSCGVLFRLDHELKLGTPIEYFITLIDTETPPINLRCIGTVLRSEPEFVTGEPATAYEVAVTLDRYEFVRESPDRKHDLVNHSIQ